MSSSRSSRQQSQSEAVNGFRLIRVTDSQTNDVALAIVKDGAPENTAFTVDFNRPQLRHRTERSRLSHELLVRAFRLTRTRAAAPMTIWDTTAGLGTDSFILASAGASVLALESNAQLFALLDDALNRYRASHANRLEDLALSFRNETFLGDLKHVTRLVEQFGFPDGIYFDPMFFQAEVSAKSLPQKGIQVLRELTAPGESEAGFFDRVTGAADALLECWRDRLQASESQSEHSAQLQRSFRLVIKRPQLKSQLDHDLRARFFELGAHSQSVVTGKLVRYLCVEFDLSLPRAASTPG